jgi:FixJ family two-component response regulator
MQTNNQAMASALIHVVDDDESIRKALTRLLTAAGYDVRTYASAGEFLLVKVEPRPACILLDYSMPGPNGLELQEALSQQDDVLPIIFLSGLGNVPTAVQAMKLGAVDFLSKPVQKEQLLEAIGKALVLQTRTRQRGGQLKTWRQHLQTLTQREREIFRLVVAGKLNKEIAHQLGTSERTVKAHRAAVMEKMHAASLAELVQISVQLGMTNTDLEQSSVPA